MSYPISFPPSLQNTLGSAILSPCPVLNGYDHVFICKLCDTKLYKHEYIASIFLKAALALRALFEVSVILTKHQFLVLSSPALLAITLLAGARFFVWLCNEGGFNAHRVKTIPDIQPQFEDANTVNYKICCDMDTSVEDFKNFLKRCENYKIGDCDSDGCSALHAAIQADNLPLIRYLAKEGGTKILNQKDNDGKLPLVYLAFSRLTEDQRVQIAEILVDSGAPIPMQKDFWTNIARGQRPKLQKYLVEAMEKQKIMQNKVLLLAARYKNEDSPFHPSRLPEDLFELIMGHCFA